MVDDTHVRAGRSRYNSTAKSWGIIHLPTPLSRVFAPAEECRKQTQLGNRGMSEKCQQETHASQQIRGFDRLYDPLDARLGFTKRSCRAKNGLTRLKNYFRTASAKMACCVGARSCALLSYVVAPFGMWRHQRAKIEISSRSDEK